MFSFMKHKEHKKDKDEKKKEKKEKKEKEKREKHREQTTPEELSRLEEVKRGVFHRKSDRSKKHAADGGATPDDEDDGGFLHRDSDSSYSLGSAGRPSPDKERAHFPEEHRGPAPAVLPKPAKSILKSKGSDRQNVSDNVDDKRTLISNTAYNQEISGVPVGQEKNPKVKPKPNPRGSKGSVKDRPPEFLPPPPPESPPPEKSYKASLQLPGIVPAKPARVRELVVNRSKAGDFGFTLRKSVLNHRGNGDTIDGPQTVIFAEPGAGQSSSQTGLIPGDKLIEVNGVNVENRPREEVVDMIRKTGDQVVLKVQPIPELIELSVRPSVDGGGLVDVQEDLVKGGTLKRSGSLRYKKPVSVGV